MEEADEVVAFDFGAVGLGPVGEVGVDDLGGARAPDHAVGTVGVRDPARETHRALVERSVGREVVKTGQLHVDVAALRQGEDIGVLRRRAELRFGEVIDQHRGVGELADAPLGLRGEVRADVQLDDQAEVGGLLPERADTIVVEGVEVILLAAVGVEAVGDDLGLLAYQGRELGGALRVFGIEERGGAQAVGLAGQAVEYEAVVVAIGLGVDEDGSVDMLGGGASEVVGEGVFG